MRMIRNRFPLWRVLFNMKVLLTRVDRGSFRFDLNFMYMTYFIFFLPSQISTQATCLQKLPDLPWLLLRYSWNLGLPFIFSVETYFFFFSLQPLNRGLLPLLSLPPDRQLTHYCSIAQGHCRPLCTSLGQSEKCFRTQII